MVLFRSIRRKLARLARARKEAWPLVQAWFLLLLADVALRVVPLQPILAFAARTPQRETLPGAGVASATIVRLNRVVALAAHHHLYAMGCLRQALVLQWLLDRRGIATDLRIGVAKRGGGLCAHAWLEYQGQPVGSQDPLSAGFVPLASAKAP